MPCESAIAIAQAVGRWIYDFQTLITGAAAIGAAWYAGAPVWRQLKERAARVAKAIDDPLWKAQDVTSDPAGEPLEIGEHDAFGVEQMIGGRLDWYLVTLEGTEDAAVEQAKATLKAALKDLTDTLSDVHWPAHNDQSGEDYSMTNEEWADVLRKAKEGKVLAPEKVGAAWKANRALKEAQEASIKGLRQQIAQLDQNIARNS